MYHLANVSQTFTGARTVHALRNIDLDIADGEFLAVRGSTGGGKSTLLQILGALEPPKSGVVELAGQDIAQLREKELGLIRANKIGIVFQNFNLIPTLTAQLNVEAALVPLNVPPAQRRQRATEMLAQVGLSERAEHLPSELSGGQQQRVAIARALVKELSVLLADEPTGNLDEETRDEVMGVLESAWTQLGFTMIVVTHDSTVAARAQRCITLREGQIVAN